MHWSEGLRSPACRASHAAPSNSCRRALSGWARAPVRLASGAVMPRGESHMATKHPRPGSERNVERGSKLIGDCDPSEKIEVFVMLRRQQQAQFDALISRIEAGDPNVKPLSREALAKEYGASPDDVAKVKAFAAAHGLTVVHEDLAARSVLLSGTIAQFQSAFEVKLEQFQHRSAGQFRGRTGTINVPDDLHGVVEAVLGLDNRPQARP